MQANHNPPEQEPQAPSPAQQPTAEVGYGRPPIATRFKKGQSGNPRGRPKGKKNMMTLLQEALDEKITVNENGKRRAISKKQAGAIQIANKVASGDTKTILKILVLYSSNDDCKKAKDNDRNWLKSSLPPDASAYERAIELSERLRERIARRQAEKAKW